MAKPPLRLGKVQTQIMEILWRRGEATAREITEELAGTEALAHSTVQTLLRKLEAKGAITHERQERTFIFRPLYQRADVVTSATRDLLSRVFDGSVYGLVAHLLQHEKIDPEERERLRKLIDEEREP
jgi:BlaI family transcriptional regulator, penicillinase repressor